MNSARASLLTLLIAVLAPSHAALAGDLFGVHSASKEVHASVRELNDITTRLPDNLQKAVAADIRLLNSEINETLDRLQNDTLPIVNDAIVTDINHMGDVVRALSDHVNDLAREDIAEVDKAALDRIHRLMAMIREIRTTLDHTISEWTGTARRSVVRVEVEADRVIVHTVERMIVDGIRSASALLFMIGVLMTGLRLLAVSDTESSSGPRRRGNVAARVIGLLFVGFFLIVTGLLSIRPQLVDGFTAEVTTHPRETHCRRYQTQMIHLDKAKAANSPPLVASTQQRLGDSRSKCHGEDSS